MVGYASLCAAHRDAFRQESGTGVTPPTGDPKAVAGCFSGVISHMPLFWTMRWIC